MTEENHDYKSQLDMKQNKISDLEKRLKFLMEKNPEMKQKVFAYNYTFIYTLYAYVLVIPWHKWFARYYVCNQSLHDDVRMYISGEPQVDIVRITATYVSVY